MRRAIQSDISISYLKSPYPICEISYFRFQISDLKFSDLSSWPSFPRPDDDADHDQREQLVTAVDHVHADVAVGGDMFGCADSGAKPKPQHESKHRPADR